MNLSKYILGLSLASATVLNCAYAQKTKLDATVAQAMQQASASQLKADITYLADDKLKGRQPGTEGYKMAADYVVERLKAYGVQPAGDNGSWLQQVNLRKTLIVAGAQVGLAKGTAQMALTYGKDIIVSPSPAEKSGTVNAPLVFAGYGITNAGQQYDDYAGINVKGKAVLIIRGAPEAFPSSEASHSMDQVTIQKNAAAHGAIAVIFATADTSRRMISNINRPTYSVLDDKGKVAVSGSFYSTQIKMVATLSLGTSKQLLEAAGKSLADVVAGLKNGKPQSADLGFTIQGAYQSTWQDVNSFNVVGKVTGTDARLKNEYVVHSAHLDHLGIGRPVEGDSLYNGAHDNASGVSSLLQIANIYSHVKVKPKRSVLFVLVTGEELGELGSGYFALHPTVPVKSIVADVNTDMPTIIAPLLSVTALGAEHSSLSKVVDEAAAYLDLTVEPDPEPKENRFVRSDQYSFVKQGIPALHIKYGSRTPDGKNNLNELVGKWRAKYYHKPQDDINGMFDFDAGAKYARLNFLIGYLVANNAVRQVWNKGDIFEVKR
ncbi:M28 family peptidase [Mucilaginibacter sp. PAMB04274]|uniref:M28 family peptidase n=1 Tax=Mucilaginibacter sp. PAMB04274 TaxID=3138568 RepID=UPI0031F61140